jgi:hypothetical protein
MFKNIILNYWKRIIEICFQLIEKFKGIIHNVKNSKTALIKVLSIIYFFIDMGSRK